MRAVMMWQEWKLKVPSWTSPETSALFWNIKLQYNPMNTSHSLNECCSIHIHEKKTLQGVKAQNLSCPRWKENNMDDDAEFDLWSIQRFSTPPQKHYLSMWSTFDWSQGFWSFSISFRGWFIHWTAVITWPALCLLWTLQSRKVPFCPKWLEMAAEDKRCEHQQREETTNYCQLLWIFITTWYGCRFKIKLLLLLHYCHSHLQLTCSQAEGGGGAARQYPAYFPALSISTSLELHIPVQFKIFQKCPVV